MQRKWNKKNCMTWKPIGKADKGNNKECPGHNNGSHEQGKQSNESPCTAECRDDGEKAKGKENSGACFQKVKTNPLNSNEKNHYCQKGVRTEPKTRREKLKAAQSILLAHQLGSGISSPNAETNLAAEVETKVAHDETNVAGDASYWLE